METKRWNFRFDSKAKWYVRVDCIQNEVLHVTFFFGPAL